MGPPGCCGWCWPAGCGGASCRLRFSIVVRMAVFLGLYHEAVAVGGGGGDGGKAGGCGGAVLLVLGAVRRVDGARSLGTIHALYSLPIAPEALASANWVGAKKVRLEEEALRVNTRMHALKSV